MRISKIFMGILFATSVCLMPANVWAAVSLPFRKMKEIIIHCGTGMRAQMAHTALGDPGYRSRFLNDKVAFIDKKPICCFKE